MNQINPFTGAVALSPQVQRQQAAEKDRHLRRVQDRSRNAALTTDHLEHQVENPEATQPVHDEQQRQSPRKQAPKDDAPAAPEDGAPCRADAPRHLDLTA